MFLHGPGHETGAIYKGDQGDVECIAEADKPCDLVRGVDVQHPGQPGGLVGHDAYHIAIEPGKAHHCVHGKVGLHLKKAAARPISLCICAVKNPGDGLPDVVGLGVLQRHQVIQERVCPVWVVGRGTARRRSCIVWRKVTQQLPRGG